MEKCPVCREGNLMFKGTIKKYTGSTTSSSYSFGKGLVGAAVFGPLGAVAGVGGKKQSTPHYQYIKEYECSNWQCRHKEQRF